MKRVRVQGDLYHGRIPAGAVYVGRRCPGLEPSPFCNPYSLKQHGESAREKFIAYLDRNPALVARAKKELAGFDLACWCKPDAEWCHADEWIMRIVQ